MVGEACLPSNAYYPRTPDYTLCSGVHVCWSEHSDSSFVYGFMILNYGFGTMTATTFTLHLNSLDFLIFGIQFHLTQVLEQPGGGFIALNVMEIRDRRHTKRDRRHVNKCSHSSALMRGLDHVTAQCFASRNERQQE